jgi:hypothetical protein
MMKIDRDNYEIYFIDYLDGNLFLGEIDLLLDFMNENPDLKEELKGLEQIKIESSEEKTPSFKHLKRTDFDHPEIFEETCIRAIENELNQNEKMLFEKHLATNKMHQKEFELFRATISEPDPFTVFENKEQLKKKGRKLVPFYWYSAAAVVLLGLFLLIPDKKQQIESIGTQVAEVASPITPEKATGIEPAKEVYIEKTLVNTSYPEISNSSEAKEIKKEDIWIVEPIEPMTSLLATVEPIVSENRELALVPIDVQQSIRPNIYSKYLTLEEYLAEEKQEKSGFLEKFALNTLKRISGDKFDYSTTTGGKVEKLEFNSKLLAFTIPLDN